MRLSAVLLLSCFSALLMRPVLAQSPPEALLAAIKKLVPEQEPGAIKPTPVAGLWEVSYGSRVYYLTGDGAYLLGGPMISLAARQNLTEDAQRGLRLAALAKIPERDMIVFAPPQPKHTVTVFTDIDCHYCRELHKQVEAYNAQGIAIRYLAFPRSGMGTPSAYKAEQVWCAKDRRKALTLAKQGNEVQAPACKSPVEREYRLGIEMDISGTPALILENGKVISGFMAPVELKRVLDGG